jgi:winged helix-turn-helix protein
VGEGSFWSVPDVACLLERDYGVTYQSLTSYRSLLKKCELSYQRPAKVYKSRSEAKVMAFEEQLEKKAGGHRSGGAPDRDCSRRRGLAVSASLLDAGVGTAGTDPRHSRRCGA